MSEKYNYESVIIDNKAILEFRECVEREIRFCTDAMKKMVAKMQQLQMLDGFEGKAAESIKTYFSEVHLFLMEAIAEALTEFESMLNQYTMDILCNVDSSPYARIPVSDLLGMRDQVKYKYLDMDETIDSVNELMNGIRDLIPMEPIQTERKAGGLGPIAIPKKKPLTYGYDYNDMLESSIHYGNCSSLLEDCEEIRSVLNQKAEMIDRITFDYAMDKLPIIQDYVEVLEGSLAEYSCVSRDMEGYQTGDYKKWETTSYLSDQMLLFSLYYTANQEEILTAKDTLQQVSIEMNLAEEKEKKYDQIDAVKEVSSFGISLIPGLGDAKDLQEAIGGMDLITGKKLSALERVLAGACVIVPVVSGSMVRIAGKNANIAEKMSRLSEKQLFKKGAKTGITMCEDAKKEMEQLIHEIRNVLEEDVDVKKLFGKQVETGEQLNLAGWGKVSAGKAEKLVSKDMRWSKSGNSLNSERIKYYLDKSRNNIESDTVILGSIGKYDVIAENEGYAYFKMSDDAWALLEKEAGGNYDEIWKVNQQFIDEQISNNKIIVLSDNPYKKYYFNDGTKRFYQREIDYILGKGYTFELTSEGLWKAVRR